MQENTIQWDPTDIIRPVSPLTKLYILLMLLVVLIGLVRLARIWIAAPPFRLSKRANDLRYLQLLKSFRSSSRHWIGLTLLFGGLVAGSGIFSWSRHMLQMKAIGPSAYVFLVQDVLPPLNLCLSVALFLFLIQWHLSKRIEWLRRKSAPTSP